MKVLNFKQKEKSFDSFSSNNTNIIKNEKNVIYFSKFELRIILNFYSKQVSVGLCRDYAIDNINNASLFSIYKHTYDKPLYQIIKNSKKGFKNNTYFLITDCNKMIDKNIFIDQLLLRFEKKLAIRKQK